MPIQRLAEAQNNFFKKYKQQNKNKVRKEMDHQGEASLY